MRAQPPAPHYDPVNIARDTWVIQQTHGEGSPPFAVHINSMLITGEQPIIVDTGTPANRDQWMEDVFGLVDPADVRWVFLSHDDVDHYGNLEEVMDLCPRATLVCSFFQVERLSCYLDLPMDRMRWLEHGDRLDAGDRELWALRPPVYDNPTTRGLFDPTTGVYWASDCFATAVPHGLDYVDDIDPLMWERAFADMHRMLSPWLSIVDDAAYQRTVDALEGLTITTIAAAHTPTLKGWHVSRAFDALRQLPALGPVQGPTQFDLDVMLAEIDRPAA